MKYYKLRDRIRGHAVAYPLQFLKDENLNPEEFARDGHNALIPEFMYM